MNKRFLILALLQAFLLTAGFAQPYSNPPSCVLNGDISSMANWYPSHGFPSTTGSNAPGSTDSALFLQSVLNEGSGVFTCYNFQQGKTYRVCFWVRNVSGWPSNPWGRLYVYGAATVPVGNGHSVRVPTGIHKELIDDSYYGPPQGMVHPNGVTDWQYISVSFTPGSNLNTLWFYPLNPQGPPPPGPPQWNIEYSIELDHISVSEEVDSTFVISSSKDTVAGCSDHADLTLDSIPPAATITWSPAVSALNAQGTVVRVYPCSTTTYTAIISDSNATYSCRGCLARTLSYTIYVDQLSNPALLSVPASASCGDTLSFSYTPDSTKPCTPLTYTWKFPDGTVAGTGLSIQVPNVISANSGDYTLEILTPKGCIEVLRFHVSITGCCRSNPGFTYTGCNPVNFSNISTGNNALTSPYWSFGDGSSSTAMNPSHIYATSTATQYTVCLTMLYKDTINGESCCNRVCQQVPVCSQPAVPQCVAQAGFNYNMPPASGNTVNFQDNSSGNGVICEYTWDFGDGSPVMVTQVPVISYSYPSAGTFNVCLTVKNCIYDAAGNLINWCTDKICQKIRINHSLVATGIEKASKNKSDVQAFPNPVSQLLSVKVSGISNATVIITSLKGAMIGKATRVNDELFTFDTNGLAPGMYFVEASNSSNKKTVKFVKQ